MKGFNLYKYLPDYISNSIFEIDYKKLKDLGIKGLCLDIDNTIIGMYQSEMKEKIFSWVSNLKDMGFSLCILSNASKKRTTSIGEQLGIDFVYLAFKPLSRGFKKALKKMNLPSNKCAMIGDQLFTDVKGGRKMGLLTILTKPINKEEDLFVKFKRLFERPILQKYEKDLKVI